jgi:hypothetical protein
MEQIGKNALLIPVCGTQARRGASNPHRNGDDWQDLGQLWISNGAAVCKGRIQIRIELDRNES